MKLSKDFGEDFPLSAEVIEAKTRNMEAKVRGRIALIILAFACAAVGVSAMIGLWDGTFNELNSVWNAAAPLVGAAAYHYLGRKNG